MTKEYFFDGSTVTSLETFYDQLSDTLMTDAFWGRNLDAFNDMLRGGYGTPDEGFIFRWTHSEASRASLSYPETVRQLEKRLKECHPTNRNSVEAELKAAQQGKGATVFDWLVEIVRDHGEGGSQSESNIRLVLE